MKAHIRREAWAPVRKGLEFWVCYLSAQQSYCSCQGFSFLIHKMGAVSLLFPSWGGCEITGDKSPKAFITCLGA